MKSSLNIFLFFFSCVVFSQTQAKTDKIKQISSSDTVVFIVKTSGCFNAETIVYKLAKQKNKERLVIFIRNGKAEAKKLNAKDYGTFISCFKKSEKKFSETGDGPCTMRTEFELKNKKHSSRFTNTTCEAEFNPGDLLDQLMK